MRTKKTRALSIFIAVLLLAGMVFPLGAVAGGEAGDTDSVPSLLRQEMNLLPGYDNRLEDLSGNNYFGEGYITADGSTFPYPPVLVDRGGGNTAIALENMRILRLNGTDGGTKTINNPAEVLSISAWMNIETLQDFNPVITKANVAGCLYPFSFGVTGEGELYFFGRNSSANWYRYYSERQDIEVGEWFHLAVSFKMNGGITFYLNGELVGFVAGASVPYHLSPLSPNAATIGRGWGPGNTASHEFRLKGMIDDVNVYAAALNADQVALDMAGALAIRQAVADDLLLPKDEEPVEEPDPQDPDGVPVLAKVEFAKDPANPIKVTDSGGLNYHGALQYYNPNANYFVESGRGAGDGKAIAFPGGKWDAIVPADNTVAFATLINNSGEDLINKASAEITISTWVNLAGEVRQYQPIVSKTNNGGVIPPWSLGITGGFNLPPDYDMYNDSLSIPDGNGTRLYFRGAHKDGIYQFYSDTITITPGEWYHAAVTFETKGGIRFYLNGECVGVIEASRVPNPMMGNNVNMQLGRDYMELWMPNDLYKDVWPEEIPYRDPRASNRQYRFGGMIDSVTIYAQALSAEQIVLDMDGELPWRTAGADDVPAYQTMAADLFLTRYDMPIGQTERSADNGRTRQEAVRVTGEGITNAVDWPEITLRLYWSDYDSEYVKPFESGASYSTDILRFGGVGRYDHFQMSFDNVVSPGSHWFRGILGRYERLEIHSGDRTVRTGTSGFELWTFPVIIDGESPVKNVSLKYDGEEIYGLDDHEYDTLTLLLPASAKGTPYELSVDGGDYVSFNVGLEDIEPGDPKDIVIAVSMTTENGYTVKNLDRPETFPNQAEWDGDVAAMSAGVPQQPEFVRDNSTIASHVGIDVARSPVEVNFVAMPHGMTGGGFYNKTGGSTSTYNGLGGPEAFAEHLLNAGFDRVYDQTPFNSLGDAWNANSPDLLAIALAKAGIKFGTVPMGSAWNIPSIQHPNITFFTHNLPDYRAPLYRALQIEAQRLGRYNFDGISIGADNAGYEAFWSWAPIMIDTPWGQAFSNFNNDKDFRIPLFPGTSAAARDYEFKAADYNEFFEALAVYSEIFKEYGYFAEALAAVNPNYVTTSGSFGTSMGVAGRGGYKYGTIPGLEMWEGMNVLQAYDWNELSSSKPLHNVALIDRLQSYYPGKPIWTIIDNFDLFALSRETRQKNYALALTRGVDAVGYNYIPNDRGALARPDEVADITELNDWIHKYGGAYSMSTPQTPVGILYVNEMSLTRSVNNTETLSEADLLRGSHEGKTTEALFMCHAAGWPAQIVTPEELLRGLPEGMDTLLLVGLRNIDESWKWYTGLEDALRDFSASGGTVLLDYESVVPSGVDAVSTGIQSYSYVTQSHNDQTNMLIDRNSANMAKLNAALSGHKKPIAASASPYAWAVPTKSGNTDYVTVVNQKHDGVENNLLDQVASINWDEDLASSGRPIYDVRLGREVTFEEASAVNLQDDAFQWFAIPQERVTAPSVSLFKDGDGFYCADVSMGDNTGIPVSVTVSHSVSGDSATVYSATGLSAKLPLSDEDPEGLYAVTVTELLSGDELSGGDTVTVVSPAEDESALAINVYREDDVNSFAARTNKPLTIALTAAQQADPEYYAQALRLADYYAEAGRDVSIGSAEPNGAVLSLQILTTSVRYPQWRTIDSDIILLGSPSDNVLLFDQARGCLLPQLEGASISYVNSAFAGEYDVLNIQSDDLRGIVDAVDYITGTETPVEPVIELDVSVTTPTIVATLAANLHVTAKGDSNGERLYAYLDVGGDLMHETALDANGKGIMRINAAPGAGVYSLVVKTADGLDAGSCEINVVAYDPASLWEPKVILDYKTGDTLIQFSETIEHKTGGRIAVTVGGKTNEYEIIDENGLILTGLKFNDLSTEDAIVVSGLKYPVLFPSYSFTFTLYKSNP